MKRCILIICFTPALVFSQKISIGLNYNFAAQKISNEFYYEVSSSLSQKRIAKSEINLSFRIGKGNRINFIFDNGLGTYKYNFNGSESISSYSNHGSIRSSTTFSYQIIMKRFYYNYTANISLSPTYKNEKFPLYILLGVKYNREFGSKTMRDTGMRISNNSGNSATYNGPPISYNYSDTTAYSYLPSIESQPKYYAYLNLGTELRLVQNKRWRIIASFYRSIPINKLPFVSKSYYSGGNSLNNSGFFSGNIAFFYQLKKG